MIEDIQPSITHDVAHNSADAADLGEGPLIKDLPIGGTVRRENSKSTKSKKPGPTPFAAMFESRGDNKNHISKIRDHQFAKSIKSANKKQFQNLIHSYQDEVYSLAFRLLNNSELAEDVMRNVFNQVFREIGAFKGGKLANWIFQLTITICRNLNNRLENRAFYFLEDPDVLGGNGKLIFAPTKDRPLNQISAQEVRIIENALKKLDNDLRAPVVLRDICQKRIEDISEILALPVDTVQIRIHRARASLLHLLKSS